MGELFLQYGILFLTGMAGIWKAVPVGLAMQLHPILIWLITSAGAGTAAILIYFFGNSIRNWLQKRRKQKAAPKKQKRAQQLLDRYGIAGLGFLGTLIIGPNMAMLVGLLLVSSGKKFLIWTLAGILFWTLALTLLGWSGVNWIIG